MPDIERKHIKVLLIDDNPNHARLIQYMLDEIKDMVLDLEYADRLSTGLECLTAKNFNIVLLDLFLDDCKGLDTFVKVHAQVPEIPLVVLSALDDKNFAIEAVQAGAQDYLVKGEVDSHLLGRSICYAIERKRAEEELNNAYQTTRNILEKAPFGIYVIDDKGCIDYVNPAMIQISGDTYEQFKNLNTFDLPTYKELGLLKKIKSALKGKHFKMDSVEYTSYYGHKTTIRNFVGIPLIEGGRKKVLMIVEDITETKQAEEVLRKREMELKTKTISLEEVNTALRVMLKKKEEVKTEIEEKVLNNIKELVTPYLEKLKKNELGVKHNAYLSIIESNLSDITSSFSYKLSSKYLNLTPTEIGVANLIRHGSSTKEIADLMHLSKKTIDFHRNNIREKLGLKNKKANLRTHLISIPQ
jgi:PAS domain S-box-containing protein